MNFSDIKKILIIRLSSLGDILLTTPLIRSLKKQMPDLTIDFVLKQQYSDLLKYNPNLSELYEYKTTKQEKQKLFKDLKLRKYDLVLDLHNNFRSREITSAIKQNTVRFDKHTIDKFLLVKFKINRLKYAGQIPERYAGALGNFELDEEGTEIFIPASIKPVLQKGRKIVGLAPGSRHFTKMWPKDYYIKLGQMLTEAGFDVVLFGGKSDLEICREISSNISNSINLCNEDKILETAENMRLCSAVVCNDSGLMHAATSVKVPVLAFFGSTVKELGFAPYKSKNLILENNSLNCRPCSHIGRESCPKKHFKCMLQLTPDTAFDKLKTLLNNE